MQRVSTLTLVPLFTIFAIVGISATVYAQTLSTSGTSATDTTGGSQPTGTINTTNTSTSGSASGSTSGTTGEPEPDKTNPIISDVHPDGVTNYAARIKWVTDDPSESKIIYGTTAGNYPYTATNRCEDEALVFSHCMYLTNLQPGTRYYFVVMSKNSAGLSAYSTGHSFTTAANTSTSGSGSSVTGTAATSGSAPAEGEATSAPPPTTLVQQPTATTISSTETSVPANTAGVRILEEPASPVPQPSVPSVKVITPASSTTIVPRTSLETPRTQLENVGTSVRTFQNAVNNLNINVQSAVTRDVEQAIRQAMAAPSEHTFDPREREARLEELKRAINEKQKQLSFDVQAALTSGAPEENPLPNIQPVLKSSLEDIALIIMNETGVSVDLSPTARTVADDVQGQSMQFESARSALLEREGLDLYTDTDLDGISDYDEAHIYHTDPRNAYSSGGALTDGEKVVLGFDVSTSTIRRVPVESPKVSGEETRNIFEVHTIAVNVTPAQPVIVVSTTSQILTAVPLSTSSAQDGRVVQEKVTFAGRALPNSFVTLYIYSTPIVVTVKTDITGAWKYTLDTELPDGDHNLYVATVDSGGKILAKSPAIPFVKTAEAADFKPLIVTESTAVDPLDIVRNNMIIIAFAGFLVFAIIALGILGIRRADPKNSDVSPE